MGTIVNTDDVRRMAHRRLPKFVFDFVDGGAEDEVTLRANRRAYEDITFRSRVLVDVSQRDMGTTVLGEPVKLPVLLAPAGSQTLLRSEGELASARAAGREGTIFALSTASGYTIEEVAAVATGPLWFQLYPLGMQKDTASLVERARNAGYKALCVTVDVPTVGKREREIRNKVSLPPRVTFNKLSDLVRRPLWLSDFAFGPRFMLKNLEDIESLRGKPARAVWEYWGKARANRVFTWEDMAWLRRLWSGPLVIKGIMTAEDAQRALDHGVNGIVVSNHGGRQLDGLSATIEVLPEIVAAVAGRAEVFIDGGIRRGADVVKAIALGARACLIGRPYLFGLAMGGEAGVRQVIQMLQSEIDRTMTFLGCRTLAEVDHTAVRWRQANLLHRSI